MRGATSRRITRGAAGFRSPPGARDGHHGERGTVHRPSAPCVPGNSESRQRRTRRREAGPAMCRTTAAAVRVIGKERGGRHPGGPGRSRAIPACNRRRADRRRLRIHQSSAACRVGTHSSRQTRGEGARHACRRGRPDGLRGPDHRADVSRPHAHVAVSNDERVVLGVSDEIGEVADLEIRADRAAVGYELQFETGKLMSEALDDGHGGIVNVPDAEDDFKTAIILEAKTAKILVQLPVVTPQRLQYRDGRRNVRGAWPTSPVERDGRKGREPIDGRKDHQVDHRRFTARPGCTFQSTEATGSAVLTGIARTSQYRNRRQLYGNRSWMPPLHTTGWSRAEHPK